MKVSLSLRKIFFATFLFALPGTVAFAQTDKTQTLIVADKRVDCVQVAPKKCFIIKTSPKAEWRLFYEEIKGFKFKENYTYTLSVKVTRRAVVPKDESLYEYTLVKILSKKKTNGSTAREFQNNMPATAVTLDSQKWMLVKIGSNAVKGAEPFIEFAENKFNGNAGCNLIYGSFEMRGSEIAFSDVVTTKMSCPAEGLAKLEMGILSSLEQTTRYEQQGKTLKLFANDRLLLTFEGKDKNSSGGQTMNVTKLDEAKWSLSKIENISVPNMEHKPFLEFASSGGFSGHTGCNTIAGKYRMTGDKISFGDMRMTDRACEGDEASIENHFTDALSKTTRFKIESGSLKLYADEKLLLTFNAQKKQ
jgi:heat shock protein HslJ